MIHDKDVMVTVRDGVNIALRVYRPDGTGPFPALFAPSPYRYDNNELPPSPMFLWRETGPIEWYVEQGYAFVHMDVRGTGASQGEYRYFDKAEQQDLYDVIEWIGTQPWCNGKVGGIGQSYYCMSQWFMGIQNPPHLACLGAYDGMADLYRYMAYPGGIEGQFFAAWWNASVRPPNMFPANGARPRLFTHDIVGDVAAHPLFDDYWKERSAAPHLDKITVPLFSIGVFAKHELHLAGNILGHHKARGPKKLFITGTSTAHSAVVDYADEAFHKRHLLPFYDHYLKGVTTNHASRPNVEYTLRGTNITRAFDTWPPPGVKPKTFFLQPGPTGSVTSLNDGGLDPALPRSDAGATTYSYPHPSWVVGNVPVGPTGPDPARGVLTFTGKPLQADVEIAGHAKLVVYGSTTRNDMDIMVKLSEQFAQSDEERAKGVQPRYAIVTRGWLRGSHMDRDPALSSEAAPYYTHETVTPLVPGRIYKFEVPIEPIAHRFKAGSRIRVEICCADSPLTEAVFAHIYRPDKIGSDTIHHDAEHPSHLVLPVLPTG